MKLTEVNCPRCNHPQKFGERKRTLSNGKTEVYIECKMCRWKHSLLVESDDKIKDILEVKKLKIRAAKDPHLRDMLKYKQKKIQDE